MKYVAGFLFDNYREQVVLVQKNRPTWQAGKWNGVGGKIEDHTEECRVTGSVNFSLCNCSSEEPLSAMQREFHEEAGVSVHDWNEFAVLNGPDYTVHFFSAFERYDVLHDAYSKTDEPIRVFETILINNLPTIANLQWLIPMALERSQVTYEIQHQLYM